jgi:glycosyltransferase involved in cell wall biosynthesis
MIEATETRERLGEAGKRVAHQFSWDSMVDAYERVLEGAIARKS